MPNPSYILLADDDVDDQELKPIRKFVWSNSDHLQYAKECMLHGAERYFTKPTSVAELDQVIAYLSTVFATTS